jgi:deazaflavin-dependent oxidoreductase (nitroreductase family)
MHTPERIHRDRTGPSRFGRLVRPLVGTLNPLVLKIAGIRRVGTVAQLHHIGRRSGRRYVVPLAARPTDTGFVLPLTFGREADWCRNVIASGQCEIRFKDTTHTVGNPRFVHADTPSVRYTLRTRFSRAERLIFRLGGINRFLLVDILPINDGRHHA